MSDTKPILKTETSPRLFNPAFKLPFVLVTALFLFWGIPSSMNDVLIKQFMKCFEVNRFQAGLVQSAYYLGYFLVSLPAALIMRRYNYKTGLIIGLLLYGTGAWLFWPAAVVQNYAFFLVALFIIASGAAFLETGANPFIALLGDPRTSERRLNFSQAFNPLGAVTGVVVGTVFIFSGIEPTESQIQAMQAAGTYQAYLREETMRVVDPYLVVGTIIFLWAALIAFTRFPKIADEAEPASSRARGSFREVFRHRHFVLGVLAQFFYVGAQVGTWSYFIQYIQDYTRQPEKTAGYFLTGTLVAFGVGRFTATWLMKHVAPPLLMGTYSLVNSTLVLLAVLRPGWLGVWALFCTSFFMSLMFPTIFALAIKELGPNTKLGSSLIIMAIIGGAVVPPLMGLVFVHTHSMALAMLAPLACYLFIVYYSFWGCKVRPVVAA